MKLDVQYRESEKMVGEIAGELVAANPTLKAKLTTDADLAAFTTAVEDMGEKLVTNTQVRAEQQTLNKAEAGIFALDTTQQAEYDKTQKALNKAAEDKAKKNAEDALTALTAAKAAGTWKDDGLTVTEKLAAMKAANDAKVAEEAVAAAALKA